MTDWRAGRAGQTPAQLHPAVVPGMQTGSSNPRAPMMEERMSTHLLLPIMDDVGPGLAIACVNLLVALALVAVGLTLILAVSSVAWLSDHTDTSSIRRAT